MYQDHALLMRESRGLATNRSKQLSGSEDVHLNGQAAMSVIACYLTKPPTSYTEFLPAPDKE